MDSDVPLNNLKTTTSPLEKLANPASEGYIVNADIVYRLRGGCVRQLSLAEGFKQQDRAYRAKSVKRLAEAMPSDLKSILTRAKLLCYANKLEENQTPFVITSGLKCVKRLQSGKSQQRNSNKSPNAN